jgi:hypothetical protein
MFIATYGLHGGNEDLGHYVLRCVSIPDSPEDVRRDGRIVTTIQFSESLPIRPRALDQLRLAIEPVRPRHTDRNRYIHPGTRNPGLGSLAGKTKAADCSGQTVCAA